MPDPSEPLRLGRGQMILLAGILLVGGFLRFYQVAKPNMWLDEIWTVEMSIGRDSLHDHLPLGVVQHQQIDLTGLQNAPPWWEIWTHLHGCPYPPLYPILLRWWMDIFGNGTGSVRSLSAVCSLLAIPVFFDICRRIFRPAPTLLATLLFAISVGQIDSAQQARCYSMLILVMLCAGDLALRMERSGATLRRVGLLILLLVAGESVHYFAAGAMFGLAAYTAVRFRGRDRWRTLAAFPLAALFFLAIFGRQMLIQQRTNASLGYIFAADPTVTVGLTLERIVALPVKFLFGEERDYLQPFNFYVLLSFGLAVLIVPLILWIAGRRDLLFWQLWMIGTVLLVGIFDVLGHMTLMQNSRYTVLAGPSICGLAVCYCLPFRRTLPRYLPAILTIAAVLPFTIRRATDGFPEVGDMNDFAHLLNQTVPADELVVFYNDDKLAAPGVWYMGWQYYLPGSSRDWMLLMSRADEQTTRQIGTRTSIWCVGRVDVPNWSAILPGWHLAGPPKECSAASLTHMVSDKK